MPSTGDIKINKAQSMSLRRSQSSNILKVCIKYSRSPSKGTVLLGQKVMFADFNCRPRTCPSVDSSLTE